MENKKNQLDGLYIEGEQWVQNLGEKTVHAKRMNGKFRKVKWLSMVVWLPFFLTPYLTWNGKQAVLFDVENRQYHLFDITIFPQDIWLLTLVLLFFAILLAAMTTILGRVFCGYLCFQTIWTDVFTWIENWIEGAPNKRRQLENTTMSFAKLKTKFIKHLLWLMISLLSGITWMLYFDVSWTDYISGNISITTLVITLSITLGAYVFAGFMREQTCLWICPYARIQGAMVDNQTILPTYDHYRGEQRGKLKKGQYTQDQGDCIDCHQCVAVCPTGVDIRQGQEYGCITCSLCIDACDSVMEKVGKPKGLIRYTSLDEMKYNQPIKSLYKRPRVLVYTAILLSAFFILVYGLLNLSSIDLKVLHDRQPLFVQLSDGSIRNKYELKIMNKSNKLVPINISFKSKIKALKSKNKLHEINIPSGGLKSVFVYLNANEDDVGDDNQIIFIVKSPEATLEYESSFFTPRSMQ